MIIIMIKSASLYTFEIDDCDKALEEIKIQFNEKLTLLKNTAGIVHCSYDFIESGVVKRVCDTFDFPIVGTTSAAQAVNSAGGNFMFTMLILTSDDVEFFAGCSKGHKDDFSGSIERTFPILSEVSALPLKMAFVFPPLTDNNEGDSYVHVFEKLCGNVPIFGTLAVEEAIISYAQTETIYNGESFEEEATYLLAFGNINPRFIVTSIPEKSSLIQAGTITKAEGNILYEIDGVPAVDFFERIGLAKDNKLVSGIEFMPFILSVSNKDNGQSSCFVRGFVSFLGDGSVLCRGTMYEGASLVIGSNSAEDILASSKKAIEALNKEQNIQAALIYSCVVRRIALVNDPQLELKSVRNSISPEIPFMIAYSGGEICPEFMTGNAVQNRFHNFSFIICLL